MSITNDAALAALSKVQHPDLGKSLAELNLVQDVRVTDGAVALTVVLTSPMSALKDRLAKDVTEALTGAGASSVDLRWDPCA